MSTRTPHLVIHEAKFSGNVNAETGYWECPMNDAPPSARPHYVTKVGGNGETVWTSQILHDRSGAVRYARRESAAHAVPLPIEKACLR